MSLFTIARQVESEVGEAIRWNRTSEAGELRHKHTGNPLYHQPETRSNRWHDETKEYEEEKKAKKKRKEMPCRLLSNNKKLSECLDFDRIEN